MKKRSVEMEKLDDLSLQGEPLYKALQSLAWVNRNFGNHHAVTKAILSICKQKEKHITLIDLGCGGGDLISAIAKSLKQHNIKSSITGIDGNANSLAFAQQKCAAFNEVNFVQADILSSNFSLPACDILISSHFMYHFTEAALANFIKHNLPTISTAIIFSELKRSRLAMLLFKYGSFLLPMSKLAKEDGLLAIKRSLNKEEWMAILQNAGITIYNYQPVPLFRILLTIFPAGKI